MISKPNKIVKTLYINEVKLISKGSVYSFIFDTIENAPHPLIGLSCEFPENESVILRYESQKIELKGILFNSLSLDFLREDNGACISKDQSSFNFIWRYILCKVK